MVKPKLVVFDLNETLIEENSWLEINLAMGVSEAEDRQLMAWGKEGVITDEQGQAILCSIYRLRGNPTRSRIAKVLQNYTYRDGAQELVKDLKSKGYEIALLSGSIDILVQKVAEELNISHWSCNNRFVFGADEILEKIETVDNDDTYKLRQLERLCGEFGISLDEVLCIGDGANDALIFKAAGSSITFVDSPCASVATETINSLKEIKKIVF